MANFLQYLADPLDIFGGRAADRAEKAAEQSGKEALGLAQDWSKELSTLYQPTMDKGLNAFQKSYGMTDRLMEGGVPEYKNFDTGGLQSLYSNYMNQSQLPEYMQANAPQAINYDNAQNTDLYKQLVTNSGNAAGNYLPPGMNADIASVANKNTYDIADRLYNDEMNEYNLAQQNNQYRNELMDQQLGLGSGLEQMMYEMGQGNYQNQMGQYAAERQQLSDYLNQMDTYSKAGQSAVDQYGKYGTQLLGTQAGTLSGMANNQLSALGTQLASKGNLIGGIGGMAGGMMGMFNKSASNAEANMSNNANADQIANYDWSKYDTSTTPNSWG